MEDKIENYILQPVTICSKHIEEKYGNKVELLTLLQKWNLEELYEYFMEQQLYVEVLQHMDANIARNILDKSNMSLGIRIEFYHQWSTWIKETPLTKCPESTKDVASQEKPDGMNLSVVLNSNAYGQSVMKLYETEKSLNENSRKLLCEAIIHFCIENNHSLTVKDSETLAKQITEVFIGEESAYYHISRPNAAPLGKLYNKYRNWKSHVNRKPNIAKGTNTAEIAEKKANETEEEGHLRILQHEFHVMAFDELIKHWNGCFNFRQKSFKDLCDLNSKKNLIDLWPMLKDALGFRLITNDYEHMYGNANKLLDTFDEFSNIMIKTVFPNHASNFKDEKDLKIWQYVIENNCIDYNTKFLIVLTLLLPLLPPSRTSKISEIAGKFYTQNEVRRNFICYAPTEVAYKEQIDAKVIVEGSIPPLIKVIGSIYKPEGFFCDFDNIRYKFFSIIKAVDLCFKAYHVFGIKYPKPSTHIWNFLNAQFYVVGKIPLTPKLQMLVKDIKDAGNAEQQHNTNNH